MSPTKEYDAVVIGAGHAGIEASLSIARAGFSVCVLTMDLESIGRMSCNPAIGGLAKGHMVREIDALGGEMGLATDASGIQFRMLNRSKGPAVWAPRAQADKKLYSEYMQRVLKTTPNLFLKQGMGVELMIENGICRGIVTKDGEKISSKTVITGLSVMSGFAATTNFVGAAFDGTSFVIQGANLSSSDSVLFSGAAQLVPARTRFPVTGGLTVNVPEGAVTGRTAPPSARPCRMERG